MYVAPSLNTTAFTCPHCQAFAHQHWYQLAANLLSNGRTPKLFDEADLNKATKIDDADERKSTVATISRALSMRPFVEHGAGGYVDSGVRNAWISKCFNCDEVAIWTAGEMAYPAPSLAEPANPDTPSHILSDYDEARAILNRSPRGAAALLRLAIQKLCEHLGEPGKNINTDIAALVKKGLDQRIQKALDALRVIGNESVHPGSIDLGDDPATAQSLFKLFNVIVDKMISEPKHVEEVYALIPPDKLKAIEERDKQKSGH